MKVVIKRLLMFFLVLATFVGCMNTVVLASNVTSATSNVRAENLSKYFTGYEGCFVLFDQHKNEYTIFNEPKSQIQVSPCSTFKILHSLIGLETEALMDENTNLKWNGTYFSNDAWNKDQTLQSAVSNSVVWYFQRVASQVGVVRMQDYLNRVDYGNRDISGGITRFWLQSSLKVSPKEQVDILRKFYNYQLPFSKRNIDIVKKLILLADEKGCRLSGKTGSGTQPVDKNATQFAVVNGWFVGYIEKDQQVYFFATNIEANPTTGVSADGVIAKEITLKILKGKKLY